MPMLFTLKLKVWDRSKMKIMTDYHDLYLKCDTLLLADAFEKFENNSLNWGLCPSFYLTAPALTSNAMLNMKKVELELISDADMYFLFEKGTSGGISYIFKRYHKTNNKSYDPKQKHIIYLDTNNSYGYARSKFLPTDGFKWIDSKEFDSNKYSSNSLKRCVLEVDLGYPKELRELHNNYLSVPDERKQKRNAGKYCLSNIYQIADFYNISIGNVKKLVPNFF